MRTAITVAKLHDGSSELVHGLDVEIQEQRKFWISLNGAKAHPRYSEIHFQESDQAEYPVLRFVPEPSAFDVGRRDKSKLTTMKKVIALIVAFAGLVLGAGAQSVTYQQGPLTTAFITTGSAVTNKTAWVDARGGQYLQLDFQTTGSSATLTTNYWLFYRSLDGSTVDTGTPLYFLQSFSGAGTTSHTITTNILMGSVGWLQLQYVTNNGAGTIFGTNVLNFSVKKGI